MLHRQTPRNSRQLRDFKHYANIDGKTMTAAGRTGKGNIQELLKMMQHADSFVKDCTTVAPEKREIRLVSEFSWPTNEPWPFSSVILTCIAIYFGFLPVVKISNSVNFFRFCFDFE